MVLTQLHTIVLSFCFVSFFGFCQFPKKGSFSFTLNLARCVCSPMRSASFRLVMYPLSPCLSLIWEQSDVSTAAISNFKMSLSCLGNREEFELHRRLCVQKCKRARVPAFILILHTIWSKKHLSFHFPECSYLFWRASVGGRRPWMYFCFVLSVIK